MAGIGGSGVVTISQTVAVAAYLDGLFSSNLDLTGLSQKYGAVTAHVRIAREPGALHATRIAAGEADALIGCDLIVAAGDELLSRLKRGKTSAVISADLTPTADFARNPNWSVDADLLIERLKNALGDEGAHSRRATPGQRAPGRPDRLQHVHARRRLAKGPGSDPPRGDRSRNRAQRRRRRRQQTGVRMGPARRA